MGKTTARAVLIGIAASCSFFGPAWAQQSCERRAPAETSNETPAVFEMRRQFLNPWFMPIAYHSIDSFFETRQVPRGPRSTPLPRADHPLDFTYEFEGKSMPADQMFDRTFTNALMIVKNGRVAYENYRNFTNAQSHFLSMSMAKSITSILIGIAIDHGAIRSVDDPIVRYVPELKGSAYDGVTIRDAIDMKSGVDRSDNDQLKAGSVAAQRREDILVRNAIPVVCEALMVGRKAEPGKTFDYSTLNTTVLGWVLERAVKQPLTQYMSKMLWQPLGAESPGFWIMDGTGPDAHPFNGLGFNAVMRDYARLGLMMLDGGKANGRQIVSARWVAESTGGRHSPTSPGAKTGYQHFWWTIPNQPAYLAIGLAGQIIYVDPATRTVIVKLSYMPLDDNRAMAETMAFLDAASKWRGR